MQWYERFGVAWAALKDGATSFWDVVTSPFYTDDRTTEELIRTAVRVPVGLGNSLYQTIAAPVQLAAEGVEWGIDKLTYPVRAYQTAINLTESPTWQEQQGYVQDWNNPLPVQIQAILDPDTWGKAWDEASEYSLAQAGWLDPTYSRVFGWKTDILDKEAVAELKSGTLFSVVTGLTDAVATWYLDPTVGVARGVSAARRVRDQFGMGAHESDPWLERMLWKHTNLGVKTTDPDLFAQSDRVNEFLAWASGRSAREILAHPMIAKMSKRDDAAGILAGLLEHQDFDTARLIIAHGMGSLSARRALLERADDLAMRIDNLNNASNRTIALAYADKGMAGNWLPPEPAKPLKNMLKPGTPPLSKDSVELAARYARKQGENIPAWTTDKRIQGVLRSLPEMATRKDERTFALINAAIGDRSDQGGIWGDMIYRVPRKGDEKRAERVAAYRTNSFSRWEETLVPGKAFGYATRIVTYPAFRLAHAFTDKRPPSWFDPNRKDSAPALQAYMRHAGIFDEATIRARMNEYLEAVDIGQRTEILHKTEKEAISKLARKYGLTAKQANLIATEALGRRNRILAKVKTGKASDDNVYGVYDEDGNHVRWALFETQEINSMPLLDLQAYDRAFKKHAGILRTLGIGPEFSAKQFLDDAFEVFNGLWSATNLLRGGYMVRNLTDDTLRAAASLGIMGIVGNLAAGVKAGLGANAAIRAKNAKTRTKQSAILLYAKLMGVPPAEAKRILSKTFDEMGRDLGSVVTQSAYGMTYRGAQYKAPYDFRAESYQRLVGSSFANLTGTTGDLLGLLRAEWQEWGVLKPDAPQHLDAWVHAIHNQIAKSELGRRFLEGMSGEEVLNWLTRTAQGRAVLAKLGRKDKHDPTELAWSKKSRDEVEELVGRAQAVVDMYVPILDNLDDPLMLRRLALEGKVDKKTLEELFPSIGVRPSVHGPTVDFNLSQGPVYEKLEAIIDFGFRWLGQIPTDKLVRHPVFRRLYHNNIKRLHQISENQIRDEETAKLLSEMGRLTREADGSFSWTNEHLRQVEHIARERSLRQINELLYDGRNKSNIAHKLRFISAFFSAWEDSITKWARIAVDKPQVVVQGAKLWNAPNKVNLGATEDEAGQLVPRFVVKRQNPETGQWEKAPVNYNPLEWNEEAYIEFRLPEGIARRMPGHMGGTITISKPSMNLVLQGNPWWLPGAGPLTQIAVGEFAKAHPVTLPEVYKWAIPYGPEDSFAYSLLPAWVRRLWDSNESITDASRAGTFIQIAQNKIMDARLHGRTLPPDDVFYAEIERDADAFYKLRAFTSFFAPFSVQFKSPYQFYIDQLQNLRQAEKPGDEMTADEKFLATYGDDFFIFTANVTKNNLGLPASREAWEKSQKVRDLIAKNPDMAAVYVGAVNDVKFDQYVYEAQKRQELQPGSDRRAREVRSPREILKENRIAEGRRLFGRYMDALDAMMVEPDVPMAFINFARSEIAKQIADQNPEWAEDYFQTDPNRVPMNVEMLTQYIAEHQEQLVTRDDIRVLAEYLTEREKFMAVLDQLEAAGLPHTLTADANRELALLWKETQERLIEKNTMFSRIFWRYLSNDMLQKKVGA